MKAPTLNQNCSCPCGHSVFTVSRRPLGRFHCHCEICQALYRQPSADVTVLWAGSIALPADHSIRFRRYRLPPALQRGTCPSCDAPVAGFLRLAPFARLAFVPSANFPDSAALPAPGMHIFHHRRVSDTRDALPKFSGYWSSELAVTRMVLRNIF